MKIKIKDNSVRYRLTKSEAAALFEKGLESIGNNIEDQNDNYFHSIICNQ